MPERLKIEPSTAYTAGMSAAAFLSGVLIYFRRRKRKKELTAHPFFARVRDVSRQTTRLPIEDPFRRAVFEDLIRIKLDIWESETRALLERTDFENLDDEQFATALVAFVHSTVAAYELEAERRGIPLIVIMKFRKWHQGAVDGFCRLVEGICDSDWIEEPHGKMVAFLYGLLGALEHTMVDAELTLADLNGELNGLRYRGITAPPWESPKRLRIKAKKASDQDPEPHGVLA